MRATVAVLGFLAVLLAPHAAAEPPPRERLATLRGYITRYTTDESLRTSPGWGLQTDFLRDATEVRDEVRRLTGEDGRALRLELSRIVLTAAGTFIRIRNGIFASEPRPLLSPLQALARIDADMPVEAIREVVRPLLAARAPGYRLPREIAAIHDVPQALLALHVFGERPGHWNFGFHPSGNGNDGTAFLDAVLGIDAVRTAEQLEVALAMLSSDTSWRLPYFQGLEQVVSRMQVELAVTNLANGVADPITNALERARGLPALNPTARDESLLRLRALVGDYRRLVTREPWEIWNASGEFSLRARYASERLPRAEQRAELARILIAATNSMARVRPMLVFWTRKPLITAARAMRLMPRNVPVAVLRDALLPYLASRAPAYRLPAELAAITTTQGAVMAAHLCQPSDWNYGFHVSQNPADGTSFLQTVFGLDALTDDPRDMEIAQAMLGSSRGWRYPIFGHLRTAATYPDIQAAANECATYLSD